MATVYEITKSTFKEEVLDCKLPVLVDFYADGCGPCEMMAPLLEELSLEYEGKIKITKFYVQIEEVLEQTNEVVKEYDIMGFPTLLIFKEGTVTHTHLGGLHRAEFVEFLDSAIV